MSLWEDENARLPERKRSRLTHYDYAQNGAYFITACTKDKKNLFWSLVGERGALPRQFSPPLTPAGLAVQRAIEQISEHYPTVALEKYVIMPNHIHLLLLISRDETGVAPDIRTVVNQLKGRVTKDVGFPCWQRSFYDHIVRNQEDYLNIWQYIENNPAKWEQDRFYENGQG